MRFVDTYMKTYEEKVWTEIVNNSTNINKTNNLSL